MKIKVEFPCGYKFEGQTGLFDFGSLNYDSKDGCPLHKFNCPPKKK